MSEHGLASRQLRQQHAAEIADFSTFKTHGVSEQAAIDYLDTPEGKLFRQRLVEADPKASMKTIGAVVDKARFQPTPSAF